MTFSFTDRYLMATSDGRDSGLFWRLWSPLEWAGGRVFCVWGEVPPVWGGEVLLILPAFITLILSHRWKKAKVFKYIGQEKAANEASLFRSLGR